MKVRPAIAYLGVASSTTFGSWVFWFRRVFSVTTSAAGRWAGRIWSVVHGGGTPPPGGDVWWLSAIRPTPSALPAFQGYRPLSSMPQSHYRAWRRIRLLVFSGCMVRPRVAVERLKGVQRFASDGIALAEARHGSTATSKHARPRLVGLLRVLSCAAFVPRLPGKKIIQHSEGCVKGNHHSVFVEAAPSVWQLVGVDAARHGGRKTTHAGWKITLQQSHRAMERIREEEALQNGRRGTASERTRGP